MQDAPATAREHLAVWLVAGAHGVSHFYMLLLIPLFPLFKSQWGISYVQLGFVLFIWNVVSVVAQTPTGFLVDRVGSRKLLVGALLLGAVAFAAAGVFPSYWALVFAAALGGLVNAVYHPADYDILHHMVASSRVGRAFAIHSFVGYIGYGLAPVLMLGLNALFGLQAALIGGALVGVIPAIPLMFAKALDHRTEAAVAKAAEAGGIRALLTPAIIGLTVFFTLISLSSSGMQNFSIPALQLLDGIPLALASAGLTCFLVGNAIGVLGGGILADKTSRHEDVAFGGFIAMAVILFVIGAVHFNGYVVAGLLGVAGIFGGILYPSRDMLVRKAAPAGAMGRTFGLVTTGFNLGGMVGPLMYGWMMDSGKPRAVFFVAAALFVLTSIAPLITERRRKAEAAPAIAPSASLAN